MNRLSPLLYVDVERMLERLGINARRAGRKKWEAVCPNPDHNDKHPSWFIRDIPGEEFHACHKCQGCGWGGGPVLLVNAVLGMGIYDSAFAREWLLSTGAAPPLPASSEVEIEIRHERRHRLKVPPDVVLDPFEDWPAYPSTYLTKRGLEDWQIDRWGLGYAPLHARDKALAGRVFIPFRDARGALLHYTARAWSPADPKRYHEPDPADCDPSALFGEARWPELESDTVVLVEGSFDALAVERAMGDEVAVGAFAGSSPNGAQLGKIQARFRRAVVLGDPNPAGRRAADLLLGAFGRHMPVAAAFAPEGEDAGSLGASPGGLGQIRAIVEGALEGIA